MHTDSVIHHGVATLEDVDLGCDTDLESPPSPEHFHMKSLDDNMFSVPATLDDKTVLGVKQERAHVDKLVNDKFNLQVENMMLRNNLNRGEGGSQAGGVDALKRAIRENNEMKEKIEQMEKELSRKRDGGIDSRRSGSSRNASLTMKSKLSISRASSNNSSSKTGRTCAPVAVHLVVRAG